MTKINIDLQKDVKWSFITRRVDRSVATNIKYSFDGLSVGDLILAQVAEIGSHKRVHLTTGRPSSLYKGDYVVMSYGNRYAPDQFEAIAKLTFPHSDLVAAGGVIGTVLCAHERMKEPTQLAPVGVLTDTNGRHINVSHFALEPLLSKPELDFIVVTGSQMNAGKTTAAASLIQGLHCKGLKVAALKATGTGAFGDLNSFHDAGADLVLDFTDMGMPTTSLETEERVLNGLISLLNHAKANGADVAVVELGDGLFQKESLALLQSDFVRSNVNTVLFAAPDSLSASYGVGKLAEIGFERVVVGGLITCAPLAIREFQQQNDHVVSGRANLMNDPFTVYKTEKYS
ncbi:molybdopterin guanine dinucleotide synthesis B family protein [Photobacterium damselae]|uniref:molybdopterin guanine dinucleotide synthesis B family protein n=1 Tax=Photobacterium damselae TaxID=38293 RepID=UPI004067FFEE